MNTFEEMKPEQITDNPFKLIGKDWMLVTVGNRESYNTMTASGSAMGTLWGGRKVCFSFIRPTHYTYEFMEKSDFYTLSFFEEKYRDILTYCGTKSGRDVNKVKDTGLTPVFEDNTIYFAEARLVLICKKIYFQDIIPGNFLDPKIEDTFPLKDYHRMYVGEIVKCLMTK